MPTTKADLILHPIRIQILTAISADRVTVKDLAKALPDIPQTTLYRHINALVEGGMLHVVDEIPQRGTVERVYSLTEPVSLSEEDLRSMNKEDYRQAFTLIMSSLLNEAMRYLDTIPDEDEFDILAAGYDFSKIQLNLSDEEHKTLNQQICSLIMAAAANKSSPERKRRIFSYLFIPTID